MKETSRSIIWDLPTRVFHWLTLCAFAAAFITQGDDRYLYFHVFSGYVFIGLLSWLVGAVLALPIGKLLSDAVGVAFLEEPLNYTFSTQGTLLWLAIVVILAALASIMPAWNASRLSVREVLAYE